MTLSSYSLTFVLCKMTWMTVQIQHSFFGGAHLDLQIKEPTVSTHSLSVCLPIVARSTLSSGDMQYINCYLRWRTATS